MEPDQDFDSLLKTKVAYGNPTKRNVMATVISDDSDEVGLIERGVELSFDKAFVTLFDRGALKKLFVVDAEAIPPRAQRDLDRMAARVEAAKPKAAVAAAPPPAPPADPIDVCVKDFHGMPGTAFKAKYLNHQGNRRFYEAAIAAGRI